MYATTSTATAVTIYTTTATTMTSIATIYSTATATAASTTTVTNDLCTYVCNLFVTESAKTGIIYTSNYTHVNHSYTVCTFSLVN